MKGWALTMWTMGKTTALGALLALAMAPVAASADPPAVGAPTIPPVFVGAPTNDNPNAGQFTVNFASNGDFEGVGGPAEPPLVRDVSVSAQQYRPQSRTGFQPSASERRSADRLIGNLKSQLRTKSTASETAQSE